MKLSIDIDNVRRSLIIAFGIVIVAISREQMTRLFEAVLIKQGSKLLGDGYTHGVNFFSSGRPFKLNNFQLSFSLTAGRRSNLISLTSSCQYRPVDWYRLW